MSDLESEFGGDPGIIQPLAKRVYGSIAKMPGDGTYTTYEQLLAIRTMDSTDPAAEPDYDKIGKQ